MADDLDPKILEKFVEVLGNSPDIRNRLDNLYYQINSILPTKIYQADIKDLLFPKSAQDKITSGMENVKNALNAKAEEIKSQDVALIDPKIQKEIKKQQSDFKLNSKQLIDNLEKQYQNTHEIMNISDNLKMISDESSKKLEKILNDGDFSFSQLFNSISKENIESIKLGVSQMPDSLFNFLNNVNTTTEHFATLNKSFAGFDFSKLLGETKDKITELDLAPSTTTGMNEWVSEKLETEESHVEMESQFEKIPEVNLHEDTREYLRELIGEIDIKPKAEGKEEEGGWFSGLGGMGGMGGLFKKLVGFLGAPVLGLAALVPAAAAFGLGGLGFLAIAGGIMMAWDGVIGFFSDEEASMGVRISNAIGGFLGGSADDSWAKKALAVGSYAFLGAKLGMAGGPLGMLAGAVLGAIIGGLLRYVGGDVIGRNIAKAFGFSFVDLGEIDKDVKDEARARRDSEIADGMMDNLPDELKEILTKAGVKRGHNLLTPTNTFEKQMQDAYITSFFEKQVASEQKGKAAAHLNTLPEKSQERENQQSKVERLEALEGKARIELGQDGEITSTQSVMKAMFGKETENVGQIQEIASSMKNAALAAHEGQIFNSLKAEISKYWRHSKYKPNEMLPFIKEKIKLYEEARKEKFPRDQYTSEFWESIIETERDAVIESIHGGMGNHPSVRPIEADIQKYYKTRLKTQQGIYHPADITIKQNFPGELNDFRWDPNTDAESLNSMSNFIHRPGFEPKTFSPDDTVIGFKEKQGNGIPMDDSRILMNLQAVNTSIRDMAQSMTNTLQQLTGPGGTQVRPTPEVPDYKPRALAHTEVFNWKTKAWGILHGVA